MYGCAIFNHTLPNSPFAEKNKKKLRNEYLFRDSQCNFYGISINNLPYIAPILPYFSNKKTTRRTNDELLKFSLFKTAV